jgi:hypothetical protein
VNPSLADPTGCVLSGTVPITNQITTEHAANQIDPLPKTEARVRECLCRCNYCKCCQGCWQTDGGQLQRTTVDSEIRRVRQRTGITFSAHWLRHFYGAALLSAGVPIPQVAKQMGHASPQVTLKVYAYALEGDAHLGRAAVADIAAKSMSCAPDVHPQAAGQD